MASKSENPYYVIEDCEGIYSGIISISSYKWLVYVFYRAIRVFVRGFISAKIYEQLLLVGRVQNWGEVDSSFVFSGKQHNGTLTIIKEDVVSKFYLRRMELYRDNRMDALVNIQKKASKFLRECKGNLNVPDILNVGAKGKYYEITFEKVFKSSCKYKIDLISALNYIKILSKALSQCTNEIERKVLALDAYINSVIMCIKNENLKERLNIESKEWINELYDGKHGIQISHGDCWIGNFIADKNTIWVIDFDRIAVLPKWYDIAHYIIQLSVLACRGLSRWFNKIIKTGDVEEVFIKFLSKQKSDSALAIAQFIRENNIPYEELLCAEIWVYRLIAICMAEMNRKGAGDEVEIIKFIEIIDKIYKSKKGFICRILELDL